MTATALNENILAGSRARPELCDPRAWQVAARIKEQEDPELLIPFGSRARGDYDLEHSDIDILLLQAEEPDADGKEAVKLRPELQPGKAMAARFQPS